MRPTRLTTAVVAGATLLTGCYTLQPATGPVPATDTNVAFDVTDVGRVALGGAMGPSIGHIEGRIVRRESDDFVLAVTSVRYLSGGEQTWNGEPVRIKPDYVGTTYLRRFSKTRTVILAAAIAGGIAFIATRAIVGGGQEDTPTNPPPTGTSSRSPRP